MPHGREPVSPTEVSSDPGLAPHYVSQEQGLSRATHPPTSGTARNRGATRGTNSTAWPPV
jgi:hypothetical protein